MGKLILLDRDGVINQDSDAFIKTVDEFVPLPGSIDAIADLCTAGFRIAICTNQSGVGRGLLTEAELGRIHEKLLRLVADAGGRIEAIRYCPHLPDAGCDCRKPAPGMITALMQDLGTAAEDTLVVGDSLRDLEAGRSAGCRAVLVRTGNGQSVEKDAAAAGFREAHDDLRAFSIAEIARQNAASRVQH